MKLFFSYGHDENKVIVTRIKEDLEKRHHEVAIDESLIKGGDDWRRTITNAITQSELMVAFASNHSVRVPGVCLDELMIAVSVKGAQVQTILLESNIEPPSNISYRQFIDMSNWREMKKTPDFESWYNQKLNEIIRVIESPDTEKYAEEIEYIRDQLCPHISSNKQERLRQEYFCGREWLSKEIQDWIKGSAGQRILLIEGAPGVGKSAYMAHEFLFNDKVGAVLFCEWDQPDFNNLDSISRSLVFQLSARLPDYRFNVINYLKNEKKRTGAQAYQPQSGDSIFYNLFTRQLQSLIDGTRPIILILIDGIDEVSEDRNNRGRKKNAFADLLHKEIDRLPAWIRFVITSRRDLNVIRPLQNMSRINIEEKSADNLKDVHQYLVHELSEKLESEIIEKISRMCAGNFLYAKMICKSIVEKSIPVEHVLEGRAGDLGFIYRNYFDRTFTDFEEYEEKYYRPLASLAVTNEPIPESTFKRINQWSDREMQKALKVLNPYFSTSGDTYSLYHKSIRDWLLDSEADDYMIEEKDGFRFIADGCFASYTEDLHRMNKYELANMIPYMERSCHFALAQVKRDEKYADLLLSSANEEREALHYETAISMAEMALNIFSELELFTKTLRSYLFLAEAEDLMVHLEESKGYCIRALKYANDMAENISSLEIVGDIYMRMAYVYFRDTEWNNSINAYDDAIKIYKNCANELKSISAIMMKANMLRHATRTDEALECFSEIERSPVFKELVYKDLTLYCTVLMYYGWTLHNVGRYREAAKKLQEAEKLIKGDERRIPLKDEAQIYYLRSIELFNIADYPEAEKYCEKALRYVCLAYGDHSVETCSALNQLGAIAQKQNDFAKAIRFFEKSYMIRLKYYGENNLFTSISLRNYAKAMLINGKKEDLDKAGDALKSVYRIRKGLLSSDSGKGWFAQSILDLACYYEKTGDYSTAEANIMRAIELYKSGGTDMDLAVCHKQMGMIFKSAGNKEGARTEFLEAIRISRKHFVPNHPYIVDLQEHLKML